MVAVADSSEVTDFDSGSSSCFFVRLLIFPPLFCSLAPLPVSSIFLFARCLARRLVPLFCLFPFPPPYLSLSPSFLSRPPFSLASASLFFFFPNTLFSQFPDFPFLASLFPFFPFSAPFSESSNACTNVLR